MVTEELITELIVCPKKAIGADRKRMLSVNRSLRNKVALISVDGNYTYNLFLRQSEEFMEDFSVGLIWTNAAKYVGINKEIILITQTKPVRKYVIKMILNVGPDSTSSISDNWRS